MGLGSGIRDPGSATLPKTSKKMRGMKKISCHTYFCSNNFHKLVNYFIFKMPKKKIFKELQNILPKKWSLSSQKYGFGIRDRQKIYSGSRIPGSKRHRIPDPQHCLQLNIFMSSDFDTGTFWREFLRMNERTLNYYRYYCIYQLIFMVL